MRTINLNKEFYGYLTNEIKTNNNLNDVDKTIASYLLYLEQTRISRNENDNDYIYPSYDAITKATNVKARQTIAKSINKLLGIGVILRIVKGSVKDGANRYWVNHKYLNQDMATPTLPLNVEYRSVEKNDNSQILRLLVEIQNEVKSLRKENQDLKDEVREMKEMMITSRSTINDVTVAMEEPRIEIAVELPSTPSNVEYRAIESANDIVEDEYEKELDDVLNMLANRDKSAIEPSEETTVFQPKSNDAGTKIWNMNDWEKEMTEKYKWESYVYDKPLSKLKTETEIRNEIEFRNSISKPLYDLKERLAAIRNIA